MRIQIQPEAENDLVLGFEFYEEISAGLGFYFLRCLYEDIDQLQSLAGIPAREFGFQRIKSRRFPFAIFYEVQGDVVIVFAVIDWRRNPAWIENRLRS